MKKGELTREKIIDAATKLFKRQGFGLTSISTILPESGLKKGALYYEFTIKEEIGFTVLERAKSELLAFLDSSLVGPTPNACLENYLHSFLEWYRSVQFDEGCIFAHLALEMADTTERFVTYVRQVSDLNCLQLFFSFGIHFKLLSLSCKYLTYNRGADLRRWP